MIIKSFVSLEKLLDLTDNDVADKIEVLWKELNNQNLENKFSENFTLYPKFSIIFFAF